MSQKDLKFQDEKWLTVFQPNLKMMLTTEVMIAEIEEKDTTIPDVAQTYFWMLHSEANVDKRQVNAAIAKRWGSQALAQIKKDARTGDVFREN